MHYIPSLRAVALGCIIDEIEWIDNKTLKVNVYSIKNGETVIYIKDPFNLTIYEKIIEEGKDFIEWFNYKFH